MLKSWLVPTGLLLLTVGTVLTLAQNGDMQNRPQQNTNPRYSTTTRPVMTGQQYAVSSMKPQATEAAVRILEAGGNAFDAAVAGHAVLALTDPAMNGIGADVQTLVYDAASGAVKSINGSSPAPRLATIEWYGEHNDNRLPVNDSLLSATVPSAIDTWYVLLDRWGTMTFAEVLQPAIEIAEQGFPLTYGLATAINNSEQLARYPTSVALYQSRTWNEGDIFRNPDAGRLLRLLVAAEQAAASEGRTSALLAARDRFYKGDIARKMAAFSEDQDALFRYDDFATYTVKVEDAVSTNYRGYDVYKNGSASQGAAELFALNIIEGYDLQAMGLNSPEYIHLTAEAVKLAMGDREKFLGDADFIDIPYEGLLSDEYAAARRAQIDPDRASLELRPGDPSRFMSGNETYDYPWRAPLDGDAKHDGDTSYIAIVDADRNMVSLEPSLHSVFGSGVVIADLGIIFNCRGDYFKLEPGLADSLEPGRRPRSTLQSSLIMKDGLPSMIMGSPGGDDQIMRTMQTLVNIVDFGMNVQEAIEAPRWSSRAFPASTFPHTMRPGDLSVESRVPVEVQDALRAKGHHLEVAGPWSLGSLGVILVDHETGVLRAGADPRVDAIAWAR